MKLNIQSFTQLSKKEQVNKVLECNNRSLDFGLALTQKQVEQILETRDQALQTNQRIEFQSTIIEDIIEEFMDSQFITKYNYAEIIDGLIEIFYYYKDATEEYNLSDEEIIHYLKVAYDGVCQGSLDSLYEEQLSKLIDSISQNLDIYEGTDYGNI